MAMADKMIWFDNWTPTKKRLMITAVIGFSGMAAILGVPIYLTGGNLGVIGLLGASEGCCAFLLYARAVSSPLQVGISIDLIHLKWKNHEEKIQPEGVDWEKTGGADLELKPAGSFDIQPEILEEIINRLGPKKGLN